MTIQLYDRMIETMSVWIHVRFIMTMAIIRKTSYFFSLSSIFLFSHGTEEVRNDGQDPNKEVDCINTNGSYNRTCKGDYVRPFQPCRDMNASLARTNTSRNCTGKKRYLGDGHERKLQSF